MYKENELYSAYEVVELTEELHYRKEDFEDGDLTERIEEYDTYIAKKIPLSEIEEVYYYVDEDMVEEFSELSDETMPPVILGEKIGDTHYIIDGCHRITLKRNKNHTDILALIPVVQGAIL